jgi:pyruvate ferredoxin oxidoreductase delta subunit
MEEQGGCFEPNFDYCKGCALCATECPVDAIEMVPEKRKKK